MIAVVLHDGGRNRREVIVRQRLGDQEHAGVGLTFLLERKGQGDEVAAILRYDRPPFLRRIAKLLFVGRAIPAEFVGTDDINAIPTSERRDDRREVFIQVEAHCYRCPTRRR